MEVEVKSGDISGATADAIIVNLFDGVTAPGGATGAVDAALDGAISKLIAQGDIRGKSGEVTIIHTFGKIPAPRVVVAGLGKQKDFDIDAVRNLSANLVRSLRKPGIKTLATIVHGAGIGGTFAWQVAFKHRDLFRGVAVVSAPLSQPPPDNDPDFPLQIVAACGQEARVQPRVEASVQLLQQMKFPAVLLPVPGKEVSPESLAAQIAAWLDALDRI